MADNNFRGPSKPSVTLDSFYGPNVSKGYTRVTIKMWDGRVGLEFERMRDKDDRDKVNCYFTNDEGAFLIKYLKAILAKRIADNRAGNPYDDFEPLSKPLYTYAGSDRKASGKFSVEPVDVDGKIRVAVSVEKDGKSISIPMVSTAIVFGNEFTDRHKECLEDIDGEDVRLMSFICKIENALKHKDIYSIVYQIGDYISKGFNKPRNNNNNVGGGRSNANVDMDSGSTDIDW